MRWLWREDKAPGTPWGNMETDQALFNERLQNLDALPIVRVYCWDRPSVTVGRLQREEEVRRAYPGLPTVRRPTGGLAVVHGADLTLSLVVQEHDLPLSERRGVLSSYRQIVGGLISAFRAVGVRATLGSALGRRAKGGDVDCFTLAARCDVVDEETGRKLVGCAQRRQSGLILQQMSVPLRGVPHETEFLSAAKAGLGEALGVTEWLSIDTADPV